MNRLKMKLLRYGIESDWVVGYYMGELNGKPAVVLQVLAEGARNIKGQMENIIHRLHEAEFPRKKYSSIRWFEYWPERDFGYDGALSEVCFSQATVKHMGDLRWASVSAEDKNVLIEEIVEPIVF